MYLYVELYVVDISGNRSSQHLSLLIHRIFRLCSTVKKVINKPAKNRMITKCKYMYGKFVMSISIYLIFRFQQFKYNFTYGRLHI